MRIFAEIVEAPLPVARRPCSTGRARFRPPAPTSSTSAACRTRRFRVSPTRCEMLKAAGLAVSVDSADLAELETGAAAGADFVLSLTEETLALAADHKVTRC